MWLCSRSGKVEDEGREGERRISQNTHFVMGELSQLHTVLLA